MNIYLTIGISAFIAAVIRGWRDQEDKSPTNALIYKWASRVFYVWAAVLVTFTIWLVGVALELWTWPFVLD